jgi:hypothetical protein
MRSINSHAPHAKLYILRNLATVQRFADEARQTAAKAATPGHPIKKDLEKWMRP